MRQAIPSKSVQASIGQPVKDATVSARALPAILAMEALTRGWELIDLTL